MLTRSRSTVAFLIAALLSSMLFSACGGDSATKPTTTTPTGTTSLAKVSGDKQVARVTIALGNALVARAYIDTAHGASRIVFSRGDVARDVNALGDTVPVLIGIPLTNKLVNFVPVDPKCGRPFAGSAITDSLGVARDRWEGGTKAGVCVMQVRYVDQTTGEAKVATEFTATFNAFPVTGFNFVNGMQDTTLAVGDSLRVAALIANAFDQYGNTSTTYLVRFRRFNNSSTSTDPGPVTAPYAIMRPGDFALAVYADSTSSVLRLHAKP